MRDRDEPLVEVGGLDRLGRVEDRLTGVGGAQPADGVAVLEVVAAVGPQHVREVVHQRVVLLGLVAVAVGDVVLRVLLEPLGGLVELLPGRVVRRRRVEAEVLLHAVAVLLEQVLAVLPDHRRRVVGQRVELVLVDEPPGGVELGGDEVADVVELRQVRVLHHRVQVDERLVVGRQHLVRVGVDDLVAADAGGEVERDLLDERRQLELDDLDLDPGHLGERLEVRRDRRGGGGVLRDEVQRRAAELLPLVAGDRLGGVGRAAAAQPERSAPDPRHPQYVPPRVRHAPLPTAGLPEVALCRNGSLWLHFLKWLVMSCRTAPAGAATATSCRRSATRRSSSSSACRPSPACASGPSSSRTTRRAPSRTASPAR